MIGQIAVQPIQNQMQLGSVKEGISNPNQLFSSLLLNAGGEFLHSDKEELTDLDVLFNQLTAALKTDDLASFLKEAEQVDPAIKQMFMMFDDEEIKSLTMHELLLAAGVNEGLIEKALNEEMTDPEQLLKAMLPAEDNKQPANEYVLTVFNLLYTHQPVTEATGTVNQNSGSSAQEELAKLILLTKGLTLIDQKKPVTEKSQGSNQLADLMETIQSIFKNQVRDQDVLQKQDVIKSSSLPDVLKNDSGMLNLQTLQLHSGPVKWSLGQAIRQPDAAQQLMEKFQQVMHKAGFGKVNGTEKLMIRLQPEHLGTLKIELLQKDGMMTAKIIASTAVAKDMIDSQLNQLRQSFTAQNLQVEKIEISQAEPAENRLNKDSENQQREQQERQHEKDQEDDEQVSFHDIFLNIEV